MKTILVVDDAPMIRELIQNVLEAEGYKVLLAADGEEAVNAYRDNEIDLSIIDIFLPKKGGLQVMGEMVNMERPPEVHSHLGGRSVQPGSHRRACQGL